jgi:hypothetical protein
LKKNTRNNLGKGISFQYGIGMDSRFLEVEKELLHEYVVGSSQNPANMSKI